MMIAGGLEWVVSSPGVSEIIFAGAKNAAPKRSLALLLRRNPLYAGGHQPPHAQLVSVISRKARVARRLRWPYYVILQSTP